MARSASVMTCARAAERDRDLKGAIAELKQDPHNKFLAKEVAQLREQLAGLRSQVCRAERPE
jgi:hypothetical protein